MITHDTRFLKEIRGLPCLACGRTYDVEAHHIKTRRTHGDDPWNVIPLCSDHHTQDENAWHRNLSKFFHSFPHVWKHLKLLGWFAVNKKLVHPAYRDQKPKQAPRYEIGSRGEGE